MGDIPITCAYNTLCVLVFGYGLGMVVWMAEFGFGLLGVAVWFGSDIPL